MRILITGGAGYIGSHAAKALIERGGCELSILDNLSTGSQATLEALARMGSFQFFHNDLSNKEALSQIFSQNHFDLILHFAASVEVFESVQNPLKYYLNNTLNTAQLLDVALEYGVKKLIFSSTAAVYGEPREIPKEGIDEEHPLKPINPYGQSKIMSERIIQDVARAHPDFKFVILRYFNVAGADLQGRIGQATPKATHLIKIATECASLKRPWMEIYGEDYPTPDGSCVRDYIHVEDLAQAHVRAMEYLMEGACSDIFNCGYGRGYSVKEVVQKSKEVSGVDFEVRIGDRRAGDPAILVAQSSKIREKMGWAPLYDDLALIIKSAYEWERGRW